MTASLRIPQRTSPSEASMRAAVAAASPGTTVTDGTYIMLNGPRTAGIR
jgi:hypothetical protein